MKMIGDLELKDLYTSVYIYIYNVCVHIETIHECFIYINI